MTLSKTERLLNYMKTGRSITGRSALSKFHLYRLSSYIERFRKRGFKIETKMITYKGITHAKYSIK